MEQGVAAEDSALLKALAEASALQFVSYEALVALYEKIIGPTLPRLRYGVKLGRGAAAAE